DDVRALAARSRVRVSWCGFLNQSEIRRVLVSVDCVAVPSAWETWGLIVNEALAAGTPCVVSDGVASGPDLIRNGISGATHAVGDVAGLADSLVRVRNGRRNGIITAESCRAMARTHSFDRATEGLVEATRRVTARRQVTISSNSGAPRVLATFGN